MALAPTDYSQFRTRVFKRIKKLTDEQIPAFVIKVGFDVLGRVVEKTPVKTGRARGGWQVNLNEIGEGAKVKSKDGGRVNAEGQSRMLKYRLGDTINLTNGVVYIVPLENGHSSQARNPTGMVKVTIAEMRAAGIAL